jgi:hypothetical protein
MTFVVLRSTSQVFVEWSPGGICLVFFMTRLEMHVEKTTEGMPFSSHPVKDMYH